MVVCAIATDAVKTTASKINNFVLIRFMVRFTSYLFSKIPQFILFYLIISWLLKNNVFNLIDFFTHIK